MFNKKYVAVALVFFSLGTGLMYLISQGKLNKERVTRRELARICNKGLEASQGIARTCGEAYKELVGCLGDESCDPYRFGELNEEKKVYEQELKEASEDINALVKDYKSAN